MKTLLKQMIMIMTTMMVANCHAEELNYKDCVVAVKSPASEGGFGITGANWISINMIQDNIKNNRGIKYLPGLTGITENGFYFYFYETCKDKMKWSQFYVNNFIKDHDKNYFFHLKSLLPKEVDEIGIREIKKF